MTPEEKYHVEETALAVTLIIFLVGLVSFFVFGIGWIVILDDMSFFGKGFVLSFLTMLIAWGIASFIETFR